MECIICKDTNREHLKDNIFCRCKYKYHYDCWNNYITSQEQTIIKCVVYRIPISSRLKQEKRIPSNINQLPVYIPSINIQPYLSIPDTSQIIITVPNIESHTNVSSNNMNIQLVDTTKFKIIRFICVLTISIIILAMMIIIF